MSLTRIIVIVVLVFFCHFCHVTHPILYQARADCILVFFPMPYVTHSIPIFSHSSHSFTDENDGEAAEDGDGVREEDTSHAHDIVSSGVPLVLLVDDGGGSCGHRHWHGDCCCCCYCCYYCFRMDARRLSRLPFPVVVPPPHQRFDERRDGRPNRQLRAQEDEKRTTMVLPLDGGNRAARLVPHEHGDADDEDHEDGDGVDDEHRWDRRRQHGREEEEKVEHDPLKCADLPNRDTKGDCGVAAVPQMDGARHEGEHGQQQDGDEHGCCSRIVWAIPNPQLWDGDSPLAVYRMAFANPWGKKPTKEKIACCSLKTCY